MNLIKEYTDIIIEQPAGRFHAINMVASDLIPYAQSETRSPYNNQGNQRNLNRSRVNEIADYSRKENAMFPTPIIVSITSSVVTTNIIDNDVNKLIIDFSKIKEQNDYFSILDGQHRLAGIEKSKLSDKFNLLVMIIFDTTPEIDADIFITINKNQKPVNKSLVYDLFGLSSDLSPEKYAHEIVKQINEDNHSLLENHIKMLGYKTDDLKNPNITQGAIMDQLMPLISKKTSEDNERIKQGLKIKEDVSGNLVLRNFFIDENIEEAAKIVISFLNAWMNVADFLNYNDTKFLKSVGFNLAMRIFKKIIIETNNANTNDLETYLAKFKEYANDDKKEIFKNYEKNYLDNEDEQFFQKIKLSKKNKRNSFESNYNSFKEGKKDNEFYLTIFILMILNNEENTFNKEYIETFESSLGGVKKIEDSLSIPKPRAIS